MRSLDVSQIKPLLRERLAKLGTLVDPNVINAISKALANESSELAKDILASLLDNYQLGQEQNIPICQDTGSVVVFIELGQELSLVGESLTEAIQEVVRDVWKTEYFRASIVQDSLFDRSNTKDNTPALIHTELVKGDRLSIKFALKGGGAENMSALKMLKPADGKEGIKAYVLDVIKQAGGNPCPPVIVGIGIGGNFETCAILAKKALFREIGSQNPVKEWADFERELLTAINATGIGPQGLGGLTTAFAVHIISAPCHIASMPVAVNLNCHAHRHCEIVF